LPPTRTPEGPGPSLTAGGIFTTLISARDFLRYGGGSDIMQSCRYLNCPYRCTGNTKTRDAEMERHENDNHHGQDGGVTGGKCFLFDANGEPCNFASNTTKLRRHKADFRHFGESQTHFHCSWCGGDNTVYITYTAHTSRYCMKKSGREIYCQLCGVCCYDQEQRMNHEKTAPVMISKQMQRSLHR